MPLPILYSTVKWRVVLEKQKMSDADISSPGTPPSLQIDLDGGSSRNRLDKSPNRCSVEHCTPHADVAWLHFTGYLIDFKMIKFYLVPICWQSMEEVAFCFNLQ